MARQEINIGVNPNDGTGDKLRDANRKINENFAELYSTTGLENNFVFEENSISVSNENGNLEISTNGTGNVVINQGLIVNSAFESNNSIFYSSEGTDLIHIDVLEKTVGINTSDNDRTLKVNGSFLSAGTAELQSDVYIGINSTDKLFVNSSLYTDLIPITTDVDLGAQNSPWGSIFANSAEFENLTVTVGNVDTLTVSGIINGSVNGRITTENSIRIVDNSFISYVDTDTLTADQNILFPDRSGTVVTKSNNRLHAVYGSAPITAIGSGNDQQGDLAFDGDFLYFCAGNYNGTSDIWKTISLSGFAETTLSSGDNISELVNDAGYVTGSYVDSAVSSIVDGAPGLLDTLNEIATAINNDENFFATISSDLATKANSADLSAVATSGDYNDLINLPNLALKANTADLETVAFTGSYNDLNDLPDLNKRDITGSVFADDSTILVNGVTGTIVGPVINTYTNSSTIESPRLILVPRTPSSAAGDPDDRTGRVAFDSEYIYRCVGDYDGSTAIWRSVRLEDFQYDPIYKFALSVPATSLGSVGDTVGLVAYDSNYMYYCTADFDGITSIWKRVPLETW